MSKQIIITLNGDISDEKLEDLMVHLCAQLDEDENGIPWCDGYTTEINTTKENER